MAEGEDEFIFKGQRKTYLQTCDDSCKEKLEAAAISPNDPNIIMQCFETLLGATFCVHLVSLFQCITTYWLKFDQFET